MLSERKTLVLDLDETLVHTSFQPVDNASFELNINIEDPSGGPGQIFRAYVYVRPGVSEYLKRMTELFNVVVFTASVKQYCDMVMERLDPSGKIQKLYRTDCTFTNGVYVKDMRRFSSHLKDVVMIDNSAISCALQPDNCIVCPAFYDNMKDRYLIDIIPLMEQLANCSDVR